MYKVTNDLNHDRAFFDSEYQAAVYIDEYLSRVNVYLEEDEKYQIDDFEIEEYFRCGYCGEEMTEGRYCSKDCSDADNTEGV